MVQTTSRFFDELSKLMVGSGVLAEGLRSEVDSVVQTSLKGFLQALDVVSREEFDVVREVAQKARSENRILQERVAALESLLLQQGRLDSPSDSEGSSQ